LVVVAVAHQVAAGQVKMEGPVVVAMEEVLLRREALEIHLLYRPHKGAVEAMVAFSPAPLPAVVVVAQAHLEETERRQPQETEVPDQL
jgi:hypothetical protein